MYILRVLKIHIHVGPSPRNFSLIVLLMGLGVSVFKTSLCDLQPVLRTIDFKKTAISWGLLEFLDREAKGLDPCELTLDYTVR